MSWTFDPQEGANYRFDYVRLCAEMNANREHATELIRVFAPKDLFFLAYFVLGIPCNHPWLVDRIREVEEERYGVMDLWPREHFKSTILTYALIIWEILQNPEERIGIMSHTRGIAKAFLQRIKVTLESNQYLLDAFPDIFYQKPEYESPRWSLDHGIVVKRQGNYAESTVEAWGLVDGMPTGKHFSVMNFDDLVTVESVNTPETMRKLRECYQMADNLGDRRGRRRVIGTIYHHADLHCWLEKQGVLKVRKYPAKVHGRGVYLTNEELDRKKRNQGEYIFSCQMMLSPISEDNQTFRREDLKFFKQVSHKMHYYILVDPAGKKNRTSDFTVMFVIGVDSRHNRYVLDMVREKLNLRERWERLKKLVLQYDPKLVGYEEYGMQSDIDYIQEKMTETGVHFKIEKVAGLASKEDRIRRLQPLFQEGRIILPATFYAFDQETLEKVDLVERFITDEYDAFPYSLHDDLLDCLSRQCDIVLDFPSESILNRVFHRKYNPLDTEAHSGEGWMAG